MTELFWLQLYKRTFHIDYNSTISRELSARTARFLLLNALKFQLSCAAYASRLHYSLLTGIAVFHLTSFIINNFNFKISDRSISPRDINTFKINSIVSKSTISHEVDSRFYVGRAELAVFVRDSSQLAAILPDRRYSRTGGAYRRGEALPSNEATARFFQASESAVRTRYYARSKRDLSHSLPSPPLPHATSHS